MEAVGVDAAIAKAEREASDQQAALLRSQALITRLKERSKRLDGEGTLVEAKAPPPPSRDGVAFMARALLGMAQQQIQRVQPVNKPLEHSPKPEKEMLETAVRKPENEMLETAVRNALRELPAPLSAHDIEAAVGRAVREADTGFAQKLDALQRSLERTEAALGALTLSVQARQKADLEQQKALLVQIETLTAAAFGERLPPRRASDVSDAVLNRLSDATAAPADRRSSLDLRV
jgi:hypothetical protein